jgi:multiple sugar transport system permease protein/putative aldouronate transport system permease protein
MAGVGGKGRAVDTTSVRDTGADRTFTIINYLILTIFLIIVLYPLIYIVSASFSSGRAVTTGKVWLWPVDVTLDGYQAIFKHKLLMTGFYNSLFYTGVGTAVNIVMTILAAYPLARRNLFGGGFIMMLFVFTLVFSGGLIPTYLVVQDLGLLNTRWALIIPGALSVWNVIITRTFFQQSIPEELREAAQLDGCSDFRFLRDCVIPLSGPIIAVNALFYAIGHWNSYFTAMIYISDQSLYPLQLVLREVLVQGNVDLTMVSDVRELLARQNLRELLKYSLIVVASVPLLIVYPFVQKHFVRGVLIGSLKG